MSKRPPQPLPLRHPDWPQRLADYIEQRRAQPFAWGAQDCCTFAGDAVLHLTGADPMADLRHVKTAAAATRLLKRHPLPALVAERMGAMQPATLAHRGDVVLIEQEARQLLGVCLGSHWAAPGDAGLVFGPMDAALGAWPAGRGA